MKDVIVIGGGASGLISAIYASISGNKVTILEKNNNLGKKILITGNGKCNYWNEFINIEKYNTSSKNLLSKIIDVNNQKDVLSLFDKIGIIPKIRDNYYYPFSGQATSIQTALIKECEVLGIEIITNCEVKKIEKQDNIFKISTTKDIYNAKKVILSTGSLACPKTGSTGDGYKFAKSLGHKIITPLPALVQLTSTGSFLKEWHGIRSDVSVSLISNNQKIKTEIGEIQLTDYGVSGICIFNLSSIVSRHLSEHKKINIEINFLEPFKIYNEKEFITFMNKRNNKVIKRTISDLLDGLLNYKSINLLLKLSHIKREDTWNNISIEKKEQLSKYLTKFTLNITGTKSFETSQTTTGGIPLSEINPNTMESLKCKNLFITGEILDVDGDCGGYNLAFAWISGMLAGRGTHSD